MSVIDKQKFKLSSTALIDLRTMGLTEQSAQELFENAIVKAIPRVQVENGQRIINAKTKLGDGRWVGVLYLDEPDHTFLIARVFWTRP